jgi:tetratricopeptide (TPR) repeat protein
MMKKYIYIIIVISVVLIGVFSKSKTAPVDVEIPQLNESIEEVNQLVEKGKYEEALSICQDLLNEFRYRNNTKQINEIVSKLKPLIKEVEKSKKSFTSGIAYFNAKLYIKAYDTLSQVIEEDIENYKVAKPITIECKDMILSDSIKSAKEKEFEQDYRTAISFVDRALVYYPDNEELLSLKENYLIHFEEQIDKEELEAKLKKAEEEADAKALAKTKGVYIGMTMEQVLGSSWGEPKDKNITITENYRDEQWVYSGGNYLYFTDGILDGIQK